MDAGEDIRSLTGEDIRGAYLAGRLSKRRFELLSKAKALTAEERAEKLDALVQVATWKRRSTRKYEHLSGAEKVEKSKRKHAAIDERMAEARGRVNWKRRNAAEKSLVAWIKTYCVGEAAGAARLLDYVPSERLAEAAALMDAATSDASTFYHVQLARGFGKTSLAEIAILYALATGRRKYALVVSAKRDAAVQIVEDLWGFIISAPAFTEDYPDVAAPLQILDGSWRRKISMRGKLVRVQKTAGRFALPTVPLEDGTPCPTAGSVVAAHGFDGHVRGVKVGSMRPDLLLIDDVQGDADAANEEIVAGMLAKIRRTFLNLGGRQRMSVLMTSTPIAPDDVSEQIARDGAWRTTSFPAVIAWPAEWAKDGHGLWGEYRRIYERELNCGTGKRSPRQAANAFYRRNRKAMDAGAEVLDPKRYDRKVQLSALQALADVYFDNGEAAFMAEQQMKPQRTAWAFELLPQTVMQRVRKGVVPGTLIPNNVLTVAATDINPSYALTTVILSFDVERTALVVGYHKTPVKISDRINDTAYHAKVYAALVAHVREVADTCRRTGVKLDAFGIDAGGKQFDPVTRFAGEAETLVGLKVTAMTGRAGQTWNPFVRSRIREPLNDTVLCRAARGGATWLAWNADTYKETAQKALGTETGAPGGCSLFDGGVDHSDFALQVTNERIVSKAQRPDGRTRYQWRSREPHDYLDALAMAYALAGANGLNGDGRQRAANGRKIAVCY